MSSYPPPQPPPHSPSQPPFDRQMMKQQLRLAKQQARFQREQVRMQMRATRRRSIVGPLVLIGLGVVFLMVQMGKISTGGALDWYAHWWPLVLIGAGLILLAEWAIGQHADEFGGQPRRAPVLGAGVVVLLVFLAIAGAGSHFASSTYEWSDRTFGHGFPGFDIALGDRHDADDTASAPLADGNSLLIRNPHGDVTVTGSSTDGQVHVSVHKEAFARTDGDASSKETRLQPVFSRDGGNLMLDVAEVEGGQADLTIQVPHGTALTVRADHGDIDVKEIKAAVSLSANSGDVNMNSIDGAVSAHINSAHSSFTAHSVTGNVTVDGRAGDVNISDVNGTVTLLGDFFGAMHLEQLRSAVTFKSSRTLFEVARIDGDFDMDSNIQASQVMGPVMLTTRDRDVTLERVQGSVKIINRNGAVSVTDAAPLSQIDITNTHGSVDVGVPGGVGFTLNAGTHNGDVENDFGLHKTGSDERPSLMGQVEGGGPQINIVTTEGDVTVRKAIVQPLPPLPPTSVIVHIGPPPPPQAPPAPLSPKAPSAPKAPKAPKAPVAPATPPAA